MKTFPLDYQQTSVARPVSLALTRVADVDNPVVGDLHVQNGTLHWVDGEWAKVQQIDARLRWLLGEWFLRPLEGVPYVEKLFVKGISATTVAAIFRGALVEIPCVAEVIETSATINRRSRVVTVTWSVRLTTGETLSGDYGPYEVTGK